MDEQSRKTAHDIINYADQMLHAGSPPRIPEGLEDDETFLAFHGKVLTIRDVISRFAKGDLSGEISLRGFVAGSMKALQAHLRHLTWQVQQVENGDFSQRIDFLGEFSEAFNSMVVQLDTTMRAVRQKEEALTHLAKTLQQEVEKRSAAVVALKKSEAKFRYLAEHDPLTGAFNRRSFLSLAHAALQNALMRGTPCCVCILDVDHFKMFNDTYGHVEGDGALKHVVSNSTATLRQSDIMGRYGGEEFIFFFAGADLQQGCGAAERIRQAVANNPVPLSTGTPVKLTASLGVSVIAPEWYTDGDDVSLDRFIAQADEALYVAKDQGRNRVCAAPLVLPSR